jgi:hypothetical protein
MHSFGFSSILRLYSDLYEKRKHMEAFSLLINVYERIVYGKVKISEVLNMRFLKLAFVKRLWPSALSKTNILEP